MVTVAEYAKDRGVTVQAVNKRLVKHASELSKHIKAEGGKRFLDDYAVRFLNERIKGNAVIVVSNEDKQQIAELTQENTELLKKILVLQEEIIKRDTAYKQLQERLLTAIEATTQANEFTDTVSDAEKEMMDAGHLFVREATTAPQGEESTEEATIDKGGAGIERNEGQRRTAEGRTDQTGGGLHGRIPTRNSGVDFGNAEETFVRGLTPQEAPQPPQGERSTTGAETTVEGQKTPQEATTQPPQKVNRFVRAWRAFFNE